jgi:uncharacterized protein
VHRLWRTLRCSVGAEARFFVTRILLLGVALFALVPVSGSAQVPQDPPVITAQGEASVRQAADLAWVQIAVESRGATPEAARQQAATAMSSVMSALRRSLPSDAIKTSSFSVQPEVDYSDNRPRVRGYVARNQIDVRVDNLDRLPAALDASVSNGATSIAGLRFDLKRRDEAEREALRLAVEDGMARAEAMARGARRTAGAIVRIVEQRAFDGPVRPMDMMSAVASAVQAPTPVARGDIEIHAQVTLTVAIR